MDYLTKQLDLPARVLMSSLFLVSGYGKLTGATATQAYMESYGVPGLLVWPAGAAEVGAGVLLVLGLGVRPLGVALALWCILSASVFHTALSDPNQMVHLLKNMTMAGAFLMLAKCGSGDFSLDARLARNRAAGRKGYFV